MITIEEEVRGVNLKGFDGYDIPKLVFFLSEHERLNNKQKSISYLYIVLKCFISKISWNYKKGNSPILFFKQKTRKQHSTMVDTVVDIVNGAGTLYFENKFSFSINGFKLMKMLLLWNFELEKSNLTNKAKRMLLNELITLKKLDFFLNKINLNNYKLLVVFYDAHTEGNFIVQKFKKLGVKTATLSHGIVLAERDRNIIDYCGVELKGTVSDYFLAWNNFSFNEAVKQGLDKNKIKVLGIPQFINNSMLAEKVNSNTFGVILENSSGEKYNMKLIKIANKIATRFNYKYKLRFHPTFKGNEYDKIIDFKCYVGNDNSLNVANYTSDVKFSLVANSTVFIELVFMKHLVYRYASNTIHDKYRDFSYNVFKSSFELTDILLNEKDESDKLFYEICTVRDVKKSYLEFFESFYD